MPSFQKHSSKSFDADIEEVMTLFIEMGTLAAEQVTKATHSLIECDGTLAEEVISTDKKIDQLEVTIDEKIVLLVAKRQPAANDLRLVMALSKGVVDIERVGDESTKIAQMALKLATKNVLPKGYAEVQNLSNQVRLMLLDALNAFVRQDSEQALAVLKSEEDVDLEYQSASRSLMTYVMEDSSHITKVINILWVLRALERIGDHARNIAEFVIYCTSGTDVRHTDFTSVEKAVQQASQNLAARQDNE